MSEEKVESILRDVSPEQCFWASNGGIAKNLQELESVIDGMDKRVFSNHVNKGKNDFSKWVADVLGDSELTIRLNETRSKAMTQLFIVKRVLELSSVK
ncbi:MAG: hypothetical protein U9O94_03360 [Nanoarchaeota archaeon]|nr:hypothetical protein [Nanoarchaeota archaeon]